MKSSLTFSIVTTELDELRNLKQLSAESDSNIKIEGASIDTQPGAAETIGILSVVISFVSGVASQLIASWIYDKVRAKQQDPKFEIYIEGVKVSSEQDIKVEVEKQTTSKP